MAKSQLRRDLVKKSCVIFATDRIKRPSDFPQNKTGKKFLESPEKCVFCPGNESKTPSEILIYRTNGNGWKIRVVPNKYGALEIEGRLEKEKIGVLRCMNGIGAHEVIISTPHHERTIFDFTGDEMNDLLWACKERTVDLVGAGLDENGDHKIEHIIIFGNHGKEAGASKEHAHWQLIGLPIIPHKSWGEIESCREYWDKENECLFCSLTKQERAAKERIVCENESFTSICHYAAEFPFETWILPSQHWPRFGDSNPKTIRSLAEILVETLRRFGKILDYPPFNIYFHDSPLHNREHDRYYHFHIEIVPRISIQAGFEFGTGLFINPTLPEEAAKCFREA